MHDKPEFNLEKLKAQTKLPDITQKGKKFNFWEFPSNGNGKKKKKKRPRYYKKQLFQARKELR